MGLKLSFLLLRLWLCGLIIFNPISKIHAEPANGFAIGVGGFDVGKEETAFESRLEYRGLKSQWWFKPIVGFMTTSDNAGYLYGGFLLDFILGSQWVSTASLAPGVFHRGEGKDLGHGLQFRSQFELAYIFKDSSRLGIAISHMSNASIGRKNPGEESLTVNYFLPISRIFSNRN